MQNQHFLPPEALRNASRLVLTQGNQLLIEGCRSLIACDEDCIRVQLPEGVLSVHGNGLSISCFAASSMLICGHIASMERTL